MIVTFRRPVVNSARRWGGRVRMLANTLHPPLPLKRASLDQLAASEESLPAMVRDCPVAMKYVRLLGEMPWSGFPERSTERSWPGPRPAPRAPFVAAYMVKIDRRMPYMSDLRGFLIEHPALVWVLGFPLVAERSSRTGIDIEASVPSRKQLGRVLRELPEEPLCFLFDAVVENLQTELGEKLLGETIALDTKHIVAWVKENNPKAYVTNRFAPDHQPSGDPDCRLGCKRRQNSSPEEDEPASGESRGEYYWGYASGVVTTIVDSVDVVLAELTRPFDQHDVTYFEPLMDDVERRLERRPRFGALDAAFDAFYIYEYFDQAGGFAAVPFVARGGVKERHFDLDGRPLCQAGLAMPLGRTFINRTSRVVHERGCYTCPLIDVADACPLDHPRWPKGGCTITMATSPGARIRHQLDRQSTSFKAVYNQRTAAERINSQALDLGIERPKLRNQQAIAHLNTLTYILIDLRALGRIRAQRIEQAQAA